MTETFECSWLCECGYTLGRVYKNAQGFTVLRPSRAPDILIIGDAEIACHGCGRIRKWFWNEHAMRRVLRYRERRV